MKAIVTVILYSVAAGGGVVAASFLKSNAAPADAHAEEGKETGSHEGKDSHGKKDSYGKKDSHGKDSKSSHGEVKTSELDYLKFKRQFVVPVIGKDQVDALVLLNIGVSLSGDIKEEVFRHEPKFRDAFMRELLSMSNAGYFNDELTRPATYEVLRETLLRAARDVKEEGIEDILILDFARQDR